MGVLKRMSNGINTLEGLIIWKAEEPVLCSGYDLSPCQYHNIADKTLKKK
jgi:hypothetical protein